MSGMIHIYCGKGKGKTTAAGGLAVREAGAGKKVLFSQFMKNGKSSELGVLDTVPGITVFRGYTVSCLYRNMTPEQREKAAREYSPMLETLLNISASADMLVLDEIVSACNHHFVDETLLCDFLRNKQDGLEVVITGRNPSDRLVALADYVTEMNKVRHPYDQGIAARLGVEY